MTARSSAMIRDAMLLRLPHTRYTSESPTASMLVTHPGRLMRVMTHGAIHRCQRDACEMTLSPVQVRLVSDYVRAHLACNVRLAALAGQVSLSPHYFSMLFKHSLGVSPHHYVLRECIYEAQRRLAGGRMSISQVALSLGFSDQSHFSQTFRKITGTTPKRYQKNLLGFTPWSAPRGVWDDRPSD